MNINKCKIMSNDISRARVISTFDYNINILTMGTMGPIKDLNIFFDP